MLLSLSEPVNKSTVASDADRETWLWCPEWFPANAAEQPCASFFEHGSYVADTDYKREALLGMHEEPAGSFCNTHDMTEPEPVSPDEWQARHQRALAKAKARKWVVPQAQDWDALTAMGDRIVSYEAGTCRCKAPVHLMEIDDPQGPRRKMICAELMYRRDPARSSWPMSDADLARSEHTNVCLPWLPLNH